MVFSSIRHDQGWLDFDHDGPLLQHNRSNILWIYDDFGEDYSYYFCQNRDFSIEEAVVSLVDYVRISMGLTHEECTSIGMSKGGSAAIRIGIRANMKNIVALGPQIAIGAYLANRKRTATMEYMAGSSAEQDVAWLNDLVPAAIRDDSSTDRHIYIVTSPYDPHCIDYLDPLLINLRRYGNFNLISTASNLARNHTNTLLYNIPLVVSLLGILAEGLQPRFGETSNGSGYDGSGHRDRHLKLHKRHGGVLDG
ncbi:hypothetical protein [Arthrobacter sp. A5]|uniref:hypothetical protein n=1 Tax=Arthrobacter sp. A5 TaxID=576926 RepID=UPI003DA8ADF0